MTDLLFDHEPRHRELWIARAKYAPEPPELTAVYLNVLERCLGKQKRKSRPADVAYHATRALFASLRECEWRKKRPPGRLYDFRIVAEQMARA
jgi:hypothetical protein